MTVTKRPTRPVILAVLAVITSWIWVPAVVAAAFGNSTLPWFPLAWFAVTVVILLATFLRNRDEFLAWLRAPFRR
ncbi:hypothetical protein ACNHUS_22055 [Actinomycetes bacterium M1A6_2h]